MSRRRTRKVPYRLRRIQRWIVKQLNRDINALLALAPVKYNEEGYKLIADACAATIERLGGRLELEHQLSEYVSRMLL